MTKTIEEAANRYAANWEAKHDVHNPELYGLIVDTYKASTERIMSLPLASRITAEEKERVREMYKVLSECIENRTADVEYLKGKRCQLVIIFGADFFKEEE